MRERISDIPDLVNHFVQKINLEMGTQVMKLEPGLMERLMSHSWSGNIRELENVLVEALVKANGRVLLLEDILNILSRTSSGKESDTAFYTLPLMEKEHIQSTLEQLRWNRTKTAKILGISPPTLRAKIRKYGIHPPA